MSDNTTPIQIDTTKPVTLDNVVITSSSDKPPPVIVQVPTKEQVKAIEDAAGLNNYVDQAPPPSEEQLKALFDAPKANPPPIPETPPVVDITAPPETQTVEVASKTTTITHTFLASLLAGVVAYNAATVITAKKVAPIVQTSVEQTQVLTDQVKTATAAVAAAESKATTLEKAANADKLADVDTLKKFYFLMKNPDESYELRTGGTVSWRYNNPGKLRYGNFAKSHKAIGQDGGLAIFATYEDGAAAVESLIFDSDLGFKGLTVEAFVNKWAPSSDGYDQREYLSYILKTIKPKRSTVLSTMSVDDRTDLINAIRDYEHWVPGISTKFANEEELKASKK